MRVNHYNDENLRVLLYDEETSDGFRAAARHVESCETCQQRITLLAGEAEWWSDARTYLLGDQDPRWRPDASWSSLVHGDENEHESAVKIVRKQLSAPSHPEMLGRLGRYDIERVIGSGGMGIVLKAHDSELNRPIAIKVLSAHLAHVGAARERFAREGRAAAAVVHEHVVAIYNVETDGDVPFLVMQFVPGRSLQARVEEDGPLGVEQILRIGVQAAAGLAAAHEQGLVHRDVKPANILLEETVERAVLTDFGLARAIDDATLTQTGVVAGTPHYMSPEQASGGPIDHRSDLFSLGSVLYFMATGRPPFRAAGSLAVLNRIGHQLHRPVWRINRDIPDALSDVIDRLLEKKPHRRFANANDVKDQLALLLSRAQRDGLGRRPFRAWPRRRVQCLAIAATVLAGIVMIGTIAYWLSAPPRQPLAAEIELSDGRTNQVNEAKRIVDAQNEQLSIKAQQLALVQQRLEDHRFAAEMLATKESASSTAAETYFHQQASGQWDRELSAVQDQLNTLESDVGR